MTSRSTTRNPVAGAAATILAVLMGAGLAACDDDADTAAPSTDPPAASATEPSLPSRSAAEVAHAYWEAIAASDADAAVALIDPAVPNKDAVKPFGRGRTLAELLDWYDVNGWEWEVGDCADAGDGSIDCDVVTRTAWSEAVGIAPLAITVGAAVSDEGVTRLIARTDECCPGNEEFHRWVAEMYPDDAAVMWGGAEMDPEILRLFETNTARFVDAQNQ